jgi:hypothetical protein
VKLDPWTKEFIRLLNRYPGNPTARGFDKVCQRIGSDQDNFSLAISTARMVRRYIDPAFTEAMILDRRNKIGPLRDRMIVAVNGLQEAVTFFQHEPLTVAFFYQKAAELVYAVEGSNELLDTNRHGRYRDHSILIEMRRELERLLKAHVTYRTLANLLEMGYRASGKEVIVDPVTLRKEIDNFRIRNPLWALQTP